MSYLKGFEVGKVNLIFIANVYSTFIVKVYHKGGPMGIIGDQNKASIVANHHVMFSLSSLIDCKLVFVCYTVYSGIQITLKNFGYKVYREKMQRNGYSLRNLR